MRPSHRWVIGVITSDGELISFKAVDVLGFENSFEYSRVYRKTAFTSLNKQSAEFCNPYTGVRRDEGGGERPEENHAGKGGGEMHPL